MQNGQQLLMGVRSRANGGQPLRLKMIYKDTMQ